MKVNAKVNGAGGGKKEDWILAGSGKGQAALLRSEPRGLGRSFGGFKVEGVGLEEGSQMVGEEGVKNTRRKSGNAE